MCQFLKKPTDFVRDTDKVETSNQPLNTKSVSFQMICKVTTNPRVKLKLCAKASDSLKSVS